MYRNS